MIEYDQIEIGDELPPLTMPVTRLDLIHYAGASGDFNIIHWNERFAREVGLPNVIAQGMFTMAVAGRIVTDWVGDPGAVVDYSARFTRPVVVPDPGLGDHRGDRPGFVQGGRSGWGRHHRDQRGPDRHGPGPDDRPAASSSDDFPAAAALVRVDGTIAYPKGSPDEVFAMLVNPEFQRRKCAATGAISYDVAVTEAGADTVIVCRRTLPTDDLPDFVRPFVAGGLELIETVTWGPATAAGARRGDVLLAFTDKPLSMTGSLDMVAVGTGTSATLVAQLVASIPLLGGRVERACEPLVHKALEVEQTVGITWLAEHG